MPMFPLNLRTPTAESYDAAPEVEKVLRMVVLQRAQQAVMCNACGPVPQDTRTRPDPPAGATDETG